MSAPRLEIDLGKIGHNARRLVELTAERGISITGVTKASLGMPELARALFAAGVADLGDSRIENIENMRCAGIEGRMILVRSPMPSQVERVVKSADVSFNTELDVIGGLSAAARAQGRSHGVVLMAELGDLREGIMPDDLADVARQVTRFPNLSLTGIGVNLACRSGAAPDARNMAELSKLAESIETSLGCTLDVVSGGNSANLEWLRTCADVGRVNNLRLGEAILLGCEPLRRQPAGGLHTDAMTLIAEVIESKLKPSKPYGHLGESAFGQPPRSDDRGNVWQTILAIGEQDTDPTGLRPCGGASVVGASSDHLMVESGRRLAIGRTVAFRPNYSALLRSMTSPFVEKRIVAPEPRSLLRLTGQSVLRRRKLTPALPS